MRVTLATFIIILFTIIAILLVKLRPVSVHYVSLEPYYAAVKYCTGWMGYNTQDFLECINDTLNNIALIKNVTGTVITNIENVSNSLLSNITYIMEAICHFSSTLINSSTFLKSHVGLIYRKYTIILNVGNSNISYTAYLALISCNETTFILLSDKIPLSLSISQSSCTYSRIAELLNNSGTVKYFSYILIKCSKPVSNICVEDERGLKTCWNYTS